MLIRMTKTWLFEHLGRNKGTSFEEGTEHEVAEDFAQKLIRRDVAEPVTKATRGKPAAEPPAPSAASTAPVAATHPPAEQTRAPDKPKPDRK